MAWQSHAMACLCDECKHLWCIETAHTIRGSRAMDRAPRAACSGVRHHCAARRQPPCRRLVSKPILRATRALLCLTGQQRGLGRRERESPRGDETTTRRRRPRSFITYVRRRAATPGASCYGCKHRAPAAWVLALTALTDRTRARAAGRCARRLAVALCVVGWGVSMLHTHSMTTPLRSTLASRRGVVSVTVYYVVLGGPLDLCLLSALCSLDKSLHSQL